MQQDTLELIIVFIKGTGVRNAQRFLDKTGIAYRQGMDSSRGKLYFYNTGPKFILTFANQSEKQKFITDYQNLKDIHELYTPDWTTKKD